MATFFTDIIDVTPASTSFTDVDLTPYGVSGNDLAIFEIYNPGVYYFNIRTKGSTDDEIGNYLDLNNRFVQNFAMTDASGYVQAKRENAALHIYLIGYIPAAEVSGVVDKVPRNVGTAGSYQTVTISEANANSLVFFKILSYSNNFGMYSRPTGSTEDHYTAVAAHYNQACTVEVDGSKQFQAKVESTIFNFYNYVAHVDSSYFNYKTNPVNINLSDTSSAWSTLDFDAYDTVPSNAVAVLMEVVNSTGSSTVGFRHVSSTDNIYSAIDNIRHTYLVKPIDSNHQIGYLTDSVNTVVRVWGYLLGAGSGITWNGTVTMPSPPLSILGQQNYGSIELPTASITVRTAITGSLELPTPTISGTIPYSGHNGYVNLPLLSVSAQSISSPSMQGSLELPLLEINAEKSHSLGTTVRLPLLRATAQGLTGGFHSASFNLPMFQTSGQILENILIDGLPRLPLFRINGRFAGKGEITLPLFQISGDVIESFSWNSSIDLPLLTIAAQSLPSHVIDGSLNMPLLKVVSEALTGHAMAGTVNIPLLKPIGNILHGNTWEGTPELPLLSILSTAYEQVVWEGSATLPMFQIESNAYVVVADNSNVYLINLTTGSVWQYTNFAFESIVKIGDYFYAANENGIYKITGYADVDQDISGSLKTGKMDLGASQLKRINDVYVSLDAPGNGITLTTTDDGNNSYSYSGTGTTTGYNLRHINHGKGAKARYWQAKVSSSTQTKVAFNDLEILFNVLGKKR